jgi:hypothetical protein
MARRNNRLSFDRLESRDLMSGNVLASIVNVGGTPELFITEAVGESGGANAVHVSRLITGHVLVQGELNSDGTRTLVNGHLSQVLALSTARDLVVDLGAGDDRLRITNARFGNVFVGMNRGLSSDADTVTMTGLKTSGRVTIDTGAGADLVTLRSSTIGNGPEDSLAINTGAGVDNVTMTGVKTFGAVNVDTGSEADAVFIRGATTGGGFGGDLNITTGAGADLVDIGTTFSFVTVKGNLIVNTFKSITEPDVDTVKITQTFADKLIAIDTGAGNDSVQMGSVGGQDVVLVAGVGDDTAVMRDVTASSQIFVAMSDGSDKLDMTFLQATNLLQVDGGLGFDRLERHLDAHNAHEVFTGWEVINGHFVAIVGGSGGFGGGLTLA